VNKTASPARLGVSFSKRDNKGSNEDEAVGKKMLLLMSFPVFYSISHARSERTILLSVIIIRFLLLYYEAKKWQRSVTLFFLSVTKTRVVLSHSSFSYIQQLPSMRACVCLLVVNIFLVAVNRPAHPQTLTFPPFLFSPDG
jgi:hypothetical protein